MKHYLTYLSVSVHKRLLGGSPELVLPFGKISSFSVEADQDKTQRYKVMKKHTLCQTTYLSICWKSMSILPLFFAAFKSS